MVERKLLITGYSHEFTKRLEEFLLKRIPSAVFERRGGELWINATKSANRRAAESVTAFREGYRAAGGIK